VISATRLATNPDLTMGHRTMRARIATVATLAAAALAFAAPPALATHGQPFGAGFGPAEAVDVNGDPVPVFSNANQDAFWMGICDTGLGDVSGSGMGTPSLSLDCFDHGGGYEVDDIFNIDPPLATTWEPGEEPSWRLDTLNQAGAHPDTTVSFWFQRFPDLPANTSHLYISDGEPKDAIVKLPPGFVGNPNAVPLCSAEDARHTPTSCPPETQVGMSTISLGEGASGQITTQRVPIYNVEPRHGKLAEFVFSANLNSQDRVNIPIVARARTDSDFGIDTLAVDVPAGLPALGTTVTLWGVPWAAAHDKYRAPASYLRSTTEPPGSNPQEGIPEQGLPDPTGNQPQSYDRSWGAMKPFIVSPSECNPGVPPTTDLDLATWRNPGVFVHASHTWDEPISGCADVPFDATQTLTPSSSVADGPTGLSADIDVPQIGDPPLEVPDEGAPQGKVDDYVDAATEFWRSGDSGSGPTNDHLSTSQLKDAVVTLPEGVSINPASAAGLAGCSDAQFGLVQEGPPAVFDNDDPFDGVGDECPAGSKVGKVEVYTPVLPAAGGAVPGEPNLVGDVVLGNPKSTDPTSGDMFRLLLVLRSEARGLVAKAAGSAVADPVTGQLTTTFAQNPRVPFETLSLQLKGGQRGTLALQQRCQSRAWSSTLTPWTAAHGAGGVSTTSGGAFTPNTNCAFGFAPRVQAGVSNRTGGATGASLTFTMTRSDGEQWFKGLTTNLPKGLLAAVGDVPLCTNAQAAAAACPAASRIGTVDAGAGSGTPFFLEKKGSAYLTEGYKGAPFGMATIVPVEAGPFRGQFALKTLVVRQALHVDPDDATASVVSDPFPEIWHGIPLRVRQVTVKVDRAGFMRNPTDCSPKQIVSKVTSAEGTSFTARTPFQASGCGKLPYTPKLGMRLIGKRQTTSGKHPRLRAVFTQPPGQAGTARAKVRLPRNLVLDPNNSTDPALLCGYDAGLAGSCPASTIIGRAKAVSPLLARPLSGPVHLVQGIRFGPTGNRIRTLPTLLIKLRGEVELNLRARSNVEDDYLVSIFEQVPDAPVSSFSVEINGGKKGLLVITEGSNGRKLSICGRQIAELDLDAHNGKRLDRDIRVKTPCKKPKKKASCKTAKQRQSKACKRRRG